MDKVEMYQHGEKGLDWGRADPQAWPNFIFLGREGGKTDVGSYFHEYIFLAARR